MVLHVFEHLPDEGAHFYYFFVLPMMEVRFVLVFVFCGFLLGYRLIKGICSQKLLLFRFLILYKGIFAETELVKPRRPIVRLEVIVDVYEGEIGHAGPIYGFSVLESPRLREGRLPNDIKKENTFKI